MVARLTSADHATISEAVHAAEAGTSGEIVTIVADRSDAYHDLGLHYAVLAMLLVPVLCAAWPVLPERLALLFGNAWGDTATREMFLGAFAAMIVALLTVRFALAYMPLRFALTPAATRRRRVRRRAVELFKVGAEERTTGRTGILIYLSLGERMAEIVADEAIHSVVANEVWGDAMAALVREVREGRIAAGMIAATEQVGVVLSSHLPRADDDANELPDRLIEL